MADDEALEEALHRTRLFGGLPARELRKVRHLGKEIQFAAGEDVTTEGEDGGRYFLILDGEADLVRGGRVARRLRAGDGFGEIALLDGGPRTATVVAVTPLTTFSLASWNFRPFVLEQPTIASAVITMLCQWLRETEAERRLGPPPAGAPD